MRAAAALDELTITPMITGEDLTVVAVLDTQTGRVAAINHDGPSRVHVAGLP